MTALRKQKGIAAKTVIKRHNPRRSARLRALNAVQHEDEDKEVPPSSKQSKRKPSNRTISKSNKRQKTQSNENIKKKESTKKSTADKPLTDCLPRDLEQDILSSSSSSVEYVLGIDEAGRGPLAGPVVAAAILAPSNVSGVVDSKKITKEEDREALYEELISIPKVRYAISVIDAQRIDEINILQATLEGMQMAATALANPAQLTLPVVPSPSIHQLGSYVVTNQQAGSKKNSTKKSSKKNEPSLNPKFYAFIDGNKIPKAMPCECEAVVKGDSKEFCIAAASILAKVTRDRLMRGYDELYPEYNLKQHKGYPTAQHMAAVLKHGASPIHRLTFAPLKHMEFDENGNVVKND